MRFVQHGLMPARDMYDSHSPGGHGAPPLCLILAHLCSRLDSGRSVRLGLDGLFRRLKQSDRPRIDLRNILGYCSYISLIGLQESADLGDINIGG